MFFTISCRLTLQLQGDYSLKDIFKSNMQKAAESCQQGGHLVPTMTESFDGWHEVAVKEVKRVGAALVRQGTTRTRL